MSYQVIVLSQAQRDAALILAWLTDHSPQGANAWSRSWLEALHSLRRDPSGFGLAPEDERHDLTIQQFFFKTRRGRRYRIVFTIKSQTVYVMHLRGPSQDLLGPDELRLP